MNDLIIKLGFTSKFVTSQTGTQIISICILPNILQRKSNQTMKFGQFAEYDI